jgi:hypothetical protein
MTQEGSHPHPVEALSAFLDREIEGPGRAEIEAHLEACPGCRALLEDLRRLDAAVGAEAAPPVPAGLARRIRARLGAAAVPGTGAADAGAADGGVADAGAIDAAVAAVLKPPRTRWSAWFGPLPLAAAASLMVVAALWLMRPDRPTAPSSPPAPAGDERTMARNDAEKDFAPAPPSDEGKNKTSSLQEARPLEKESRPQGQPRVSAPKNAAPRAAPEAAAPAPSGERDQPAVHEVEEGNAIAPSSRLEAGATAAVAPGASAGGPGDLRDESWPVRIEAPPYHVVLTADNKMIVSQGAWTCAVALDPADGHRLVRMARAETALYLSAPATASATPPGAPSPDGATKSATRQTASSSAAAPRPTPGEAPQATPAARPLTSAGEAALQLIRGRYRAQIEEHCVHVLP